MRARWAERRGWAARALQTSWLLLGLALGGLLATAQAQTTAMPPELAAAWRATKLPDSALSLVVRELDGPSLMDVRGDVVRNPASVMKLVTTWAGLSGLGPEYTWRTAFYTAGALKVDGVGTLSGPLYLKAGGDPLLSHESLWALLRQLRLRGIKHITELVVDRSVFGDVGIDPGAFDQSGDRPYNASPDAMMVGLGAVRLVFQPDAQARKWVVFADPPLPGLQVQGEVKWQAGTCHGSPTVGASVTRTPQGPRVQVQGAATGSCGEFSVYRLADSQRAHFEGVFRMLWKELGGTLARGVRDGTLPAGAQAVVWHDSASLADLIRRINKQSNNVMARHLLLTLAAQERSGATAQQGAAAAMALLASQQVDTRGWVLDNGSGLSRVERVTARGLTDMLQVAWRSPLMPEFFSSLAISGVDGTVRRRLRSDETRGMAHLKTGSLRDVRALAGYVLGASGKRYALVSLVNHEQAEQSRSFNDALVRWLSAR